MAAVSEKLKHIVVLMMSNRSFDHMLGALKAQDPRIDGLTGDESNPDNTGTLVKVQPKAVFQGQLDPDPDHHFPGVDLQIFGGDTGSSRTPNMQGFVKSYFQQRRDANHSQNVMYYFTRDKLPVLTTLATEFAVFNRWFSSIPGPSVCNRTFAHYGTSFGQVGMDLLSGRHPFSSIFERLTLSTPARTARFYYYDQNSSTLDTTDFFRQQPTLFGTYDQFLVDCMKGMLPDYCFVDPNHLNHEGENGEVLASDQHPDHHVQAGELFIASVYRAIRANEDLWHSTALLILYDEHGGLYDHVAPPQCVPDGFVASPNQTGTGQEFKFDRLGVRVPAILVSPWIPRGTVVDRVFEHASIPATVTSLFIGDYEPRSPREKSADTFLDLLSLSVPRTDAPIFGIDGDDAEVPASKSARKQRRSSTPQVAHPARDSAVDPDSLQPSQLEIAGFRSDDASGKDLLGITDEVKRLCSVLAAKDVKPPVSIGLFGEWGSGKTFFMRQMEKQFNHIKTQARHVKGETAYCANIVQLWFNAWHYIEENIWASLAAEIFDGLARALAFEAVGLPEKAAAEQVGMGLRVEKDTVEKERDAAIKEKGQAEDEAHATQEKLNDFQEQAARLADKSDRQNLLKAAAQAAADQPEIQNEVDKIQQGLDRQVATVLNVPVEKADGLVSRELLRVKGVADDLGLIWSTLRHSRNRWLWVFSLLGAVLAVAAVPLLRPFAEWLSPRVAALLGALIGACAPAVRFLSALARIFRAQKKAIDESIRVAQAKHEQQRAELVKDRDLSVAKVREKEDIVKAKNQKLKALDETLEKLRPDRQIMDFLESRQKSSDYKKHLGVIAQAHADFEELSILLAKVQEQESKREKEIQEKNKTAHSTPDAPPQFAEGKERSLPRVDRIVLYIDDLDRCPEDKVVQVLQAIHLLLFFPLFVVVVGVDPRWMLHSLRQHLRAFQDVADGNNELSDGERIGWESTPLNYLEKIFQIPYVVLPMRKEGFEQLVQSLTSQVSSEGKQDSGRNVTVTGPQGTPTGPVDPKPGSSPSEGIAGGGVSALPEDPGRSSGPTRISIPEVFDPNPKHLQLQDCERDFMKLLHPFIHSPRATKRFVNVYRLLRTSVEGNELEMFVNKNKAGEYQAVQLLLAIQTGYPDQAAEITDELMDQKPHKSWWTFIQNYATRPRKRIVTTLRNERRQENADTEGGSQVEDEYWQEFVKCMNSVKPQIRDRSCVDFVKWAPRVGRYSFRSSRILGR